jgi:hypothetical protein
MLNRLKRSALTAAFMQTFINQNCILQYGHEIQTYTQFFPAFTARPKCTAQTSNLNHRYGS